MASPSGDLRIMKFGGAALRDGEGVRRVAGIVGAASGPRVVVASALEGVTDRLEAALDAVPGDEGRVGVLMAALRARHVEVLDEVAPGDEGAAAETAGLLERLERVLYGVASTAEASPRVRDLVLGFGERLSAPIVAAALRVQECPATALDAEGAGMRTHGPFGAAQANMEATRREAPARVLPVVDRGHVPVVTGFYGVDGDGQATVFGRGGSDTVAALLGHALGAVRIELWKEVAGFLTADPRSVDGAALVPELTYAEAAQLAQFGAKVLHAPAVVPARLSGIPIHVRSVHDPDAPGTTIHADARPAAPLVRGIASRDGLGLLRVEGAGAGTRAAAAVIDAWAGLDVAPLRLAAGPDRLLAVVEEVVMERARDAAQAVPGVVEVQALPGRSLVCVVGRGLAATPGAGSRILAAVSDALLNVEAVHHGADPVAFDFVVQRSERASAVQAVHDRLCHVATPAPEVRP